MANGWRVTGQRGTSDLINGRFVPAMEVSVELDDGTTKTFTFPEPLYTPDRVAATIDEWAERARQVAALGNG